MTLTPTMKKVLLFGGAAVVGFIIYKKMKGSSAGLPAVPPTKKPIPAAALAAGAMKSTATMKIAGLEEELGIAEDLGSLSGSW